LGDVHELSHEIEHRRPPAGTARRIIVLESSANPVSLSAYYYKPELSVFGDPGASGALGALPVSSTA
jgi:hypothetical protein